MTLEQQANADTQRAIQFHRFLKSIETGHFGVHQEKDIMRNLPKNCLSISEFMGVEK